MHIFHRGVFLPRLAREASAITSCANSAGEVAVVGRRALLPFILSRLGSEIDGFAKAQLGDRRLGRKTHSAGNVVFAAVRSRLMRGLARIEEADLGRIPHGW